MKRAIRTLTLTVFAALLLGAFAQAQTAPTASTPEAKALARKVADATADAKLLATIKNNKMSATILFNAPQGEMELSAEGYVVFPDRQAMKLTASFGEIRTAVTPTGGFRSFGPNAQEVSADEAKQQSAVIAHTDIVVLQNIDNPAYVFALRGDDKVGGVAVKVLDITYQGSTFTWFVDPTNGRVLQVIDTGFGMQGPYRERTVCSNWKQFGGVWQPTHVVNYDGESVTSTVELKSIEFNVTVDESYFKQ